MFRFKLTARLFADEIVSLAFPFERRSGRELGKPYVRNRIYNHVVLQIPLVFVQRQIRLHEVDQPVIDPVGNGLSVDRVEWPLGLLVRVELHEYGKNLQIVVEYQLAYLAIGGRGQTQSDLRQV